MRVLPSDGLLAAVREQDALFGAVLGAEEVANRVVVQKREDGVHRVEVLAPKRAVAAQAEHPEVEWAIRQAYGELARQALQGSRQTAVA
jgi:hypothetical protein